MARQTCLNCGKEFNAKPSAKRKFCSKECWNAYFKKNGHPLQNKTKVKYKEVKCAICGKIEYVLPSRAKTYKTCSKECLRELQRTRRNEVL